MLVLTNEFFIMHLLFYSQKWDHIVLKLDAHIAFCYFKIWVLILLFLQDFAKAHFQKTKECSVSGWLMTKKYWKSRKIIFIWAPIRNAESFAIEKRIGNENNNFLSVNKTGTSKCKLKQELFILSIRWMAQERN